MHENSGALTFWQGKDVITNGGHTFVRDHAGFRSGCEISNIRGRSCLTVRLVEVDGGRGTLVTCVTGVIDAKIRGNPIKPGGEASFRPIRLAGAINPQKHLLRELFGNRLVMHHAEHEVDNRLAVLPKQHIEGGHIAGAQLQHDRGIVHASEKVRTVGTSGAGIYGGRVSAV